MARVMMTRFGVTPVGGAMEGLCGRLRDAVAELWKAVGRRPTKAACKEVEARMREVLSLLDATMDGVYLVLEERGHWPAGRAPILNPRGNGSSVPLCGYLDELAARSAMLWAAGVLGSVEGWLRHLIDEQVQGGAWYPLNAALVLHGCRMRLSGAAWLDDSERERVDLLLLGRPRHTPRVRKGA